MRKGKTNELIEWSKGESLRNKETNLLHFCKQPMRNRKKVKQTL